MADAARSPRPPAAACPQQTAHMTAPAPSATAPSAAFASASARPSLSAWLGVAFWKKPLHLITSEELPGHGGGAKHRESPSSNDTEGSDAGDVREVERTLGLFDLIMIGIGGTVGAGVFATAGLIASVYAGPGAVLSWLIAGLGCILSGLSFMELSCLIPSAGSTYAYAYHALGELPAMFAGFLLTLEYGVSSAGGARSWSDKFTNWLETEWQVSGPEWMKPKDSTVDLYAGLLMSICVVIVLCGMQAGKVLVNVVTMTKISVVVFIIVFGFLKFDAANMTPFIPEQETNSVGQAVFGWPGVFLGASASFFGYIGYDEVCCLAGEAKNPTYNIPRAVIGTIVGAAVLSTLATFSLVGMQRYTEIDAGESYGKAFEHVGWPWAATIVSTGEVLTMPITTFIGFMAQPRVQYAMAKDGLLPAVFARLDHHGNMFYGTLLCGVGVIFIATFVPFKILWNFISLGILVAFNLTNASLLLVRGSRLKDDQSPAGSHRATNYTRLFAVFLVTSFLAAFHWQKSVIAPFVVTEKNAATASYFQHYMFTTGPHVAALCSIMAFGTMCGLKLIEAGGFTASKPRARASPPAVELTFSTKQSKIRRIAVASDGDDDDSARGDDEKEFCDSPASSSELELGHLRRAKHNHKPKTDDDTVTEDETADGDSDGTSVDKKRAAMDDISLSGGDDDGEAASDDDDNDKSATFQAPLVPFSPCVAIFFNWFLFAQMDASSVGLIALWLLLALAVYVSYSAHHSLARQQLRYHRLQQ